MTTAENTLAAAQAPLADRVESRRPGRRSVGAVSVGTGALLLALAACGNGDPQGSGPAVRPSSPPSASPSVAPSMAPSPSQSNAPTWPGAAPESVPYPGRVALPNSTCRTWGIEHPQPTFIRDGKLFAVIDARRSIPPNCDYLRDSGAAAYKGASYKAEVQQQPEGNGFVPDGTVVEVTAYSIGQRACNDAGTSPVWIGYKRDPADETNWSPVINLGGSPTEETMRQNSVPELPTEYVNTVHANC